MKVYYIVEIGPEGKRTLYHWGLFTMKHSAQEVIDNKLPHVVGFTYSIEETFVPE